MKTTAVAFVLCLTLLGTASRAPATEAPFRYMTAQELERKLKADEPVIVFDIQVEAEYAQHHIKGNGGCPSRRKQAVDEEVPAALTPRPR